MTVVTVPKSLESVDRTARVLRVLGAGEPLPLAEVARRSELSEATALRYLSSLCVHGLAERVGGGRYQLGWELVRLGQSELARRVPRETALPLMEQLREEFDETVNLAVRHGDSLTIVEVLESRRSLKRVNEVGQTDPWHASALGKSILAYMPAAERAALLERIGLPRLTTRTIVDRESLERELEVTRRRGYATDHEEVEDGVVCVAAAVPPSNGAPVYALSVSFPSFRADEEILRRAGEATRETSGQLGSRLGGVA